MSQVNYKLDGEVLTIYLSGRVDTTTVPEIEADISNITSSNSYKTLNLDIENVLYVSSAGLRTTLKLKKECDDFHVLNASFDVYDVFDMTGFTKIIDVRKAYRKLSVEGLDVIGKGAKGTVYRYNDDIIVKVYNNPDSIDTINNERRLAQKAFILGIPTAISYDVVKVGDKFGSVFELLASETLSDQIIKDKDNLEKYAGWFADILKTIHSTVDNDNDTPDVRISINKWFKDLDGALKPEVIEKIKTLVNNVKEDNHILHMDYHTNNILIQNGEPLLIDMDTLSHGNPIFEFANVYAPFVGFEIISRELIENFLGFEVENTKKFFELVVKKYFGDDNQARNDKIELLGLARTLRHASRRKESLANYETIQKTCSERIEKLLETVTDISL